MHVELGACCGGRTLGTQALGHRPSGGGVLQQATEEAPSEASQGVWPKESKVMPYEKRREAPSQVAAHHHQDQAYRGCHQRKVHPERAE